MLPTFWIRTVSSLAIAAAACSASGVSAQAVPDAATAPAPEDGVADIIVTAQKREQNLQRVGISISAFGADEIRNRNIASGADLVARTPSVDNYSPYGPGTSANIVIRGIGLNDFGEGHEAPVTVYVDEFYIVSVPAVDFALFDLARAEVLRGPQGTLFGRNATGGLVHYITAKPGNEPAGFVKATVARFGEIRVEGAVNAPLTDRLSARLSFLSHHSDGYIRNLNPAFAQDRGAAAGTDALRAQLRYRDDDWDVTLKGEYGRQRRVQSYYEQVPSVRDAVTGLASPDPTGTDDAGYNEARTGAAAPNVSFTSDPQRLRAKIFTTLLRAERTFDAVTVTSISGYTRYTRFLQEDCDASPNRLCYATFPYQSDTATQEVRLFADQGDVRLTAGAYGLYARGNNQPDAVFNIPVGGPTAVSPTTGLYTGPVLPINLAADWQLRTTSIAAFAQAEYEVAPRVTLIGGARITHDNKKFSDSDNASLRSCPGFALPTSCFAQPAGPGIANPYGDTYRKTLFSGKLEADFQVDPNTLLFLSASRGAKAGGFNNGFYPGGISTDQIPYGDEHVYAYEAGHKSTFFDRKVRINTSIFYYDYHDFQTFNFQGVGGLLTNQDGKSYGAETDVQLVPLDGLTLRAGGSYLRTRLYGVTNGTPAGGTYVATRDMANAPRWTANGGVSYAVPLAGDAQLTIGWTFDYRAARFSNNFNDPASRLPAMFRHDADATLKLSDTWQLQGFVRNISNTIKPIKSFPFNDLGYTQMIYSEPRVFGAAVTCTW